MTFPIINDYRNALSNASGRFATLKMEPVLDAKGMPVFMAGNFAVVFKVRSGHEDQQFALKCFIRDLPDLAKRQSLTSQYIAGSEARYLVESGFLAAELFTNSTIAPSADYPVVVMPWIEGNSLGSVLKKLTEKNHRKGLAAMAKAWANLCLDMLSRGIAHGDLKHDNILVTPEGQLRLIDYDSMYTPQMKGMHCVLLGGASYQHPSRNTRHFNGALDHFSMLVVLLSMRALTINPALYEPFNTGENIIFSAGDFTAPNHSALISQLQQSPDGLVRNWTAALVKSCAASSIAIPAIERILRDVKKVTEEPLAAGGGSFFSRSQQQAVG
jgi:serine/threonine protein kinase